MTRSMVERDMSRKIREIIGAKADVDFNGLRCQLVLTDNGVTYDYGVHAVTKIKDDMERRVQFLTCDNKVLEWERANDFQYADGDLERCGSAQDIVAAMPLQVAIRLERIVVSACLNHAIQNRLWEVSAVAVSTWVVHESDKGLFLFLYLPVLFAVSEMFRLSDVVTDGAVDFDKLYTVFKAMRSTDV